MRSIYLIIMVFFLSFSEGFSQHNSLGKQKLNDDWEFVRIDITRNHYGDGEQGVQNGSDWHSQFNIERNEDEKVHELTLSDSLIYAEHQWLNTQEWRHVSLPHTAKIEPYTVVVPWEGIAYYRKKINLKKSKNTFLKLEGAMQLTDVWVDKVHVLQHVGGYTPFSVNLNQTDDKQEVEVLVRVDNRDHPLIPPGKPIENLDFCYYSGIYRDVFLIEKEDLYITDAVAANKIAGGGVFVTFPEVEKNKAEIDVKVNLANKSIYRKSFDLIYKFIERKTGNEVYNRKISQNLGSNQEGDFFHNFNIKEPNLWSPETPYLYDLVIEVHSNGNIVDTNATTIGLRKIEITRENGFVINNQPLRLVGTNRHMDYPYVGNALPENATYRDIFLIKEAGFNTVRLGHYPQDPVVYEVCNELGLLVINPMPGWQYYNKDQRFIDATYQDIRDMIRRDRNHPSIIMWETILNEAWPPKDWKDGAQKVAHEEYPYKGCFTSGDMYGYEGWDILYNDWKEDITRPSHGEKPGFIREYGDYEFGGHFSTTRKTREDDQEGLLQNAWNFWWSHNRYRKQYPATIGDANWSMYDYNRGCCENVCNSGIAELNRLPKFSYYFFRSQIDIGTKLPSGEMPPMLFVANWWNKPLKEDKLIIFSNVEEVAILLDGKEIKRQLPDAGDDSEYEKGEFTRLNGGLSFNGGNSSTLKHPPFTFNNIHFSEGKLEAVGYVNNQEITRSAISTPSSPHALTIHIEEYGRKISNNDLVFVHIQVNDSEHNLCTNTSEEVVIEVNGGLELMSPKTITAHAGIAVALLKIPSHFNEGVLKVNLKRNKSVNNELKIEMSKPIR